jgi:predicted 3-demethylubiquinone-9 3-methyltransferase (glyoxalase superfamily)
MAHFKFNDAVSFQINCDDQQEVDYYWEKVGEGGDEKAQQCGWLKDKYGLSWQVIPVILFELLSEADKGKSRKVMEAMLK